MTPEASGAPRFVTRLPHMRQAFEYATRLHRGQRRACDDAPFIVHPIEVASLLYYSGCRDEVVAAGLLHDVIEVTSATAADVARSFGPEIARLVAAVTDDATIESWQERKRRLRRQVWTAGTDAGAIFAADKVARVRELRTQIESARRPGRREPSREQKLDHYRRSLAMLEGLMASHAIVARLRRELELLDGGGLTVKARDGYPRGAFAALGARLAVAGAHDAGLTVPRRRARTT
jgi:HD domain-containing protein